MSENKCNFHLYLGKKDYEILQWKNSLPPKCFKYFVEQILLSYINGYKIMLPPIQAQKNIEFKSMPIHIVIQNEQIASFLSQLNSGEKSKIVKEIFLFYFREAQDNAFVSSGKKKKKNIQPSVSVDIKKIPKEKPKTVGILTPVQDKPVVSQPVEKEVKETIKPNVNISIPTPSRKPVESTTVEQPKTEERKSAKNNPMMQALFKMSGDE